jgi:hypothetical protein
MGRLVKKASPTERDEKEPIRLMLAYLCVATEGREASLVRKVAILDRFGLTDKEIARVCNVTPQSVANARLARKQRS